MLRRCSVFLVLVCCGVLSWGTAMAGGVSLYDALCPDGKTSPIGNFNDPRLKDYKDTGAEAARITDTDGVSDHTTADILFEFTSNATNIKFGIYGFYYDTEGKIQQGNDIQVFDGEDDSNAATTLHYEDGAFRIGDEGPWTDIGDTFGFYLTVNNNTLFSHNELNETDTYDPMLLFDTRPYDSAGSTAIVYSSIVLAWEDWTDGDYNDFTVGMTNTAPAPVPEPGTMALLGVGLMGLGFMRRRRDD